MTAIRSSVQRGYQLAQFIESLVMLNAACTDCMEDMFESRQSRRLKHVHDE